MDMLEGMQETLSGLLLAAGQSRRMRAEKALLQIDGLSLWERQRRLLAAAGVSELFLSARPEQTWTRAVAGFDAVLHDAFPHAGPIAGICAGLERMGGSHLAVVAIDLPKLPLEWLRLLQAQTSPGMGCVGSRDGFFEPLAAIYPRTSLPLFWERLARGDFSLQSLIAAAVERQLLRVEPIAPARVPWFENWNEPADVR